MTRAFVGSNPTGAVSSENRTDPVQGLFSRDDRERTKDALYMWSGIHGGRSLRLTGRFESGNTNQIMWRMPRKKASSNNAPLEILDNAEGKDTE